MNYREMEIQERPVDWYRCKLDPDVLADLNRRSNVKGFLQAGAYLTTLVVTGGLAIWLQTQGHWWGWIVLAVYLHGVVRAFSINAVHELVHGTVFRWRWLNELFAGIFAFLGWNNHKMFWQSHKRHHRYTLHPPDDLEVVVPIKYSFSGFAWAALINPWWFTWTFTNIVRIALGRPKGKWERHLLESRDCRHAVFNWARIMLSGHIAIAVISLYYGYWIVPVIVSLAPGIGQLPFQLCNSTQHVGLQENVRDFRLNCRTFYLNPILRFLYWHMNYHIEHHMYAAVPCYNLAKLHRLIKDELPRPNDGLVDTWFEIIGILWRQAKDPNYVYVPKLPGDEEEPETEPVESEAEKLAPGIQESVQSSRVWECSICGFVYDEARGLPEEGIAPGTAWDEIPDDWCCPDCGTSKAQFVMVEITDRLAVSA